MSLTASQIIDLLNLKPHPTCGYMGEAFRSALRVPPANLPDAFWPATAGGRDLGGVLYFLVTSQTRMRMHRIRSDQMYHHYLGGALEVLLLSPGGKFEVCIVGADLAAGQRPQLLVPGGTFHISRLTPGSDYALLATSVWLRAEPADVEMGDRQKLLVAFPSASREIEDFMED
jgi:predicted cupin superfamily sugar epimerase